MPTTSYPRWAGDFAGMFVHDLARRLVAGGHRVSVIAPHAKGTASHEVVDGVDVRRVRYWRPASQQRLAYGSGIPDNLRRSRLARLQAPGLLAALAAATLRASGSADLIHAHFAHSGAAALLASRFRRCPLVVTTHGSDILASPGGRTARHVMDAFVRRADAVITVTDTLRDEVAASGQTRVRYVTNAVDMERFRPVAGRTVPGRIVYTGRMVEIKGHRYLIEALPAVLRVAPNVRLILIGDGALRSELEALAAALGVEEQVVFLGNRTAAEVADLLETANVYVQPSLSTHGVALTLMEALASGVPCITTEGAGARHILTAMCGPDALRTVPPHDAAALAEAIISVLRTPSSANAMGAAARATAEELFSWDRQLAKTLAVYREVLAARSQRSPKIRP